MILNVESYRPTVHIIDYSGGPRGHLGFYSGYQGNYVNYC